MNPIKRFFLLFGFNFSGFRFAFYLCFTYHHALSLSHTHASTHTDPLSPFSNAILFPVFFRSQTFALVSVCIPNVLFKSQCKTFGIFSSFTLPHKIEKPRIQLKRNTQTNIISSIACDQNIFSLIIAFMLSY